MEKDLRFKYFKKENGGVSAARNFGIEKASGEWILPLDGDDKLGKDYLSEAALVFSTDVDIIYSHAEYFGEKNGRMPLPAFDEKRLLLENQIFCTAFFRKKDFQLIGGFDESMLEGYEDWEFWIHLLEKKNVLKTFQLNITGLYYRIKTVSRNQDAIYRDNILLRTKIYQKHSQLFFKHISTFIDLDEENKVLKNKINYLTQNLNAVRYKIVDKLLALIKK